MYSQAAEPIATLVFAHGAGGDMHHRTMASISKALLGMGIATLRFNFPLKGKGTVVLASIRRRYPHQRKSGSRIPHRQLSRAIVPGRAQLRWSHGFPRGH
ncbi:MAG: hypothetical protein CM1200mP9_01220 [Gammaproteobacteria bacterium]|nr:MAG: hypothetical protein CM1200mP9_01220 [Gammaproteobacteria bacterium]